MSKYIAFLRAINVGGHNVKMDELKKIFEALNFSNVETFIASGNVIFETTTKDTTKLEKKIESKLHEALGYEVATFLRTPQELAEVANYKPFKTKGEALNVAFIAEPLEPVSVQKLMTYKNDIDDFYVHGREIYWMCQVKQSDSKFSNAVLEKAIGKKSTLRGINTVQKMAEKYS
ncbi:MAG: DUF1697 domain-containing protein [Anaerolineales bacterium]